MGTKETRFVSSSSCCRSLLDLLLVDDARACCCSSFRAPVCERERNTTTLAFPKSREIPQKRDHHSTRRDTVERAHFLKRVCITHSLRTTANHDAFGRHVRRQNARAKVV